MKFESPMLVVADINKSVQFYKELFGLEVVLDFGANKTLTGGLALQTLETYKELMGRPIDPKYIIGYYMNGDISTFEYNSRFYGFKEGEKESDIPELNLEKIQEENERIKQKNVDIHLHFYIFV